MFFDLAEAWHQGYACLVRLLRQLNQPLFGLFDAYKVDPTDFTHKGTETYWMTVTPTMFGSHDLVVRCPPI